MNLSLSKQRVLLLIATPAAIISTLLLILKSSTFQDNPNELAFAITIDLLVLIPVIHYLIVRRTKIPNISAVPVFVLGLVLGYQILPHGHQDTLALFSTWILPIVEVSVFIILILKVRKFRIQFQGETSLDFYDRFRAVAKQEFPSVVARLLSTEISVIYYGFLHWKRRTLEENEFSYHLNNGTPAMLFALILIVGVEVFAVHIWIVNYSAVIAWVLSIASIYSGLQLFGFAKSMLKRPYQINTDRLELRYGILAEASIPFTNIKSFRVPNMTLSLLILSERFLH